MAKPPAKYVSDVTYPEYVQRKAPWYGLYPEKHARDMSPSEYKIALRQIDAAQGIARMRRLEIEAIQQAEAKWNNTK